MNTSSEHTGDKADFPRARARATATAALSVLVLLAGCTSGGASPSPGAPTTSGRTSGRATLEAEQDLVVDGHHFKAQCTGHGPSVLLVIGYGGTMDDWGDVPTRLGATARTCMYDRLGVGRSDSPPAIQTFEDIAADLDGVITALRLPRPVVLVGHSLGAPIAVTWAAHHHTDARALVLLDPSPPGFETAIPSLMPPPDPGDPELASVLAANRRFNDPATNRESLDPRSWTTYDRIDRLDVPLWDVVGDQRPQLPAAVDADKFAAAWTVGQRRLASLASGSHVVTATGADDVVWRSHPDLVVSTVTDALTP